MLRLWIAEWGMLHILTMQKIEMTGLAVTVMRLGDKKIGPNNSNWKTERCR